jgi:hypothetical protein
VPFSSGVSQLSVAPYVLVLVSDKCLDQLIVTDFHVLEVVAQKRVWFAEMLTLIRFSSAVLSYDSSTASTSVAL